MKKHEFWKLLKMELSVIENELFIFFFFIISEHNLRMKNNSVFRYFVTTILLYIYSLFYIVYVVN